MAGVREATLPAASLHIGARPGRRAPEGGASILVDARGIQASGIGRYVREILSAIFADPRFTRIRLLGEADVLRDYAGTVPNGEKAEVLPYPYGFYSPRAQAAWLALRAGGGTHADVAFFPHYDAPMFAMPRRSVVTVQDLIHFKVPQAFPPSRRLAAGVLLRRVVSGAGRILVSSGSTRRDLLERFPGIGAKIEVTPFGVNPFFHVADGAAHEDPGIGHPYLLCVGNRKPHKNLVAAVEAMARLRTELPELRLVVVGQVYEGWEEVLRRAHGLEVHDRLIEFPVVSDSDLRALYAGCEALLFLSLYEGFGLPVLEAMACGAPVVSSNRSSLPEVVGDAGILLDPTDHAAVASAVLRLRREPGLREELVRRGRARVRGFTWEACARATADTLFREATADAARRPHAGRP